MNRKIFFYILVLIIFFVFIFNLFIKNKDNVSEIPPANQEEILPKEEIILEEVVEEKSGSKDGKEKLELKNEIINDSQISSKSENIEAETLFSNISEDVDLNDSGNNSLNEVVITKEFKYKSPSRYTFVGYGVQKIPPR